MNTVSKILKSLLLASLTVGSASAADTIRLGQVSLSFYAVTGGIVQHVLESEGYAVEVIPGSHAEIYPKVGAGEVDILAASWLPSAHAGLYKKVEGSTFKLAKLYDDARLYWTVPSYVPADQISSVADLVKPEVKAKLPTTIVSLPESTGLTTVGREVVKAYGLDVAGYELKAASPAEWIGTFKQAYEAKEWIVFPLWQPQWINAVYDLRVLDEPKAIYGTDSAFLIAHEGLKSKLSDRALRHLGNIRLSVAAITEMDRLMNVEKLSPRDAADRWIANNPDIVASWQP